MSDVTSFSLTAASNNGSPPDGYPEGQAVSSLNDCGRELMRAVAKEAQINAVKVLASVAGTDTITGSMTPDLAAYSAGMTAVFTPANTNTATAVTLNIDSLGALDVLRFGGQAIEIGDLVAGIPAHVILDSGADDWILVNPQNTGYRNLPLVTSTGSFTLDITHSAKTVMLTGTSSGVTFTIPANSSVAYATGTALTFVNSQSNDLSIAIATDTMTLAGTTTTGTRTLAQNGIATAIKTSSTGWIISGSGLS